MREHKSIEEYLILVAVAGVLIATLLVTLGWALDLHAESGQNIPLDLLQTGKMIAGYRFTFRELMSFNANNLITLGILALILAQILRVVILTVFYLARKDFIYFFICAFVLLMLGVNLFLKI